MRHIRRCVIGTGGDGQSYTQFDRIAPVGMTLGKTGAVGAAQGHSADTNQEYGQ